jgi:hypothetical protein
MRPLLHSSRTSSVNLGYIPTTVFQFQLSPGMNKKKQAFYNVLMRLIVLMFAIQTIVNICYWYITWRGFIHYSNAPDQALDTFEGDDAKLLLRVIDSVFVLLSTLKLAIADSIMVSPG